MAGTWIDRFEGLAVLPASVAELLVAGSHIVKLPGGSTIFHQGQPVESLLFVLDGSVRVQQVSGNGREVFLYRVHPGESCVLTTACMLAHESYAAEGIAETNLEAVNIPRGLFSDLAGRSQEFLTFVFLAYSRRMTDLFKLIDEIAFQRLDVRLAKHLLQLADGDRTVRATHSYLGNELGTAREVVSRTLGDFQ